MSKPFLSLIVAVVLLLSLGSVAFAQTAGQSQTGSAQPYDPRDLSGLWGGQSTGQSNRTLMKEEPPMTAWGLEKYKAAKTEFSNPPAYGTANNDPVLRCEPGSSPRTYGLNHPIELFHTPKAVLMLLQVYRNYRIFYTDGRKAPDHPEGTWYGDSVARWDGNTLVVDTINFNGRNWLDQVGHPVSEMMHLTERLTRGQRDRLTMDITVDDSMAYTRPWGGTITWRLLPATEQIEDYMCSPADEAVLNNDVRFKADPKQ